MTDYDKYKSDFDHYEKFRASGEEIREQRTFDIAAGGLTLSVGIFVYLSANNKAIPSKWMIVAIMIAFGLAIIVNYISHFVSIGTMTRIQKRINTHLKNGDKYNYDAIQKETKEIRALPVFNWVVLVLILLGVCLVVIYGILNVI